MTISNFSFLLRRTLVLSMVLGLASNAQAAFTFDIGEATVHISTLPNATVTVPVTVRSDVVGDNLSTYNFATSVTNNPGNFNPTDSSDGNRPPMAGDAGTAVDLPASLGALSTTNPGYASEFASFAAHSSTLGLTSPTAVFDATNYDFVTNSTETNKPGSATDQALVFADTNDVLLYELVFSVDATNSAVGDVFNIEFLLPSELSGALSGNTSVSRFGDSVTPNDGQGDQETVGEADYTLLPGSITIIPEPNGGFLAGLCGLALALFARRRRQ